MGRVGKKERVEMNNQEFKKIIRQGFDEASPGYDNPAMRFFDKSAAHLVELLTLHGDENILDVATGTGKIALQLAEKLKNGKVTGLDLSEGMLDQARVKVDQKHLTNLSFICSDINEAKFADSSFDGVCCGFGVFFWSDMEGTVKQIAKWIKPGGFFAMTSFFGPSFTPLSTLCLDRFKKYGVKLPDSYTWERLDHPEKHHHLLQSSGFYEINSHTKPMGYFLKDANQWWDLVCHTGFRSFLNQLSSEDKVKYKKEHLEEIEKTKTKDGILLQVDVIFTVAKKKQ